MAPSLAYIKNNYPFILDTAASQNSIGAVLSRIRDNQEVVIGYLRKRMGKTERNFCVTSIELLAVVKSIEHLFVFVWQTLSD